MQNAILIEILDCKTLSLLFLSLSGCTANNSHSILCFRHGHWEFSARSATWRSATNQRSALTTTQRILRAPVDPNTLTPGTSVRFAVGSSQWKRVWESTCPLYMVLVTSRPSSVTFALVLSRRSRSSFVTWTPFTRRPEALCSCVQAPVPLKTPYLERAYSLAMPQPFTVNAYDWVRPRIMSI